MFVTSAFAQTASASTGGSAFASLWIFVLFFAIMYFFIIRPQRQQAKKREDMLKAIRRGDNIITGGGIVAKVVKVHEDSDELTVEIAPSVEVRVLRGTVTNIRVKGQPISDTANVSKAKKKANERKNIEKEAAVEPEIVEEVIEEKTEIK